MSAPSSRRDCLPTLFSLVFALVLPMVALAAATQSPLALPGDRSLSSIAENADLRLLDWDSFFAAKPRDLLPTKARLLENVWGSWKRQVVSSGGFVYLIYAAGRGGNWPIYSQGSWIVKRALATGALVQAKIFLKSDPGTFIRIFPDGDRSRMDLVVYGGVYRSDVPLPWSFDRTLRKKVGDIIEATRLGVDWSLFEPEPADYRTLSILSSAIRARLPGLRYLDDGGLDAEGRLVYIASGALQLPEKSGATSAFGLNCSGFSQWVVDGLVKAQGASWIDRTLLAEKHLDTRKSAAALDFEDSLDPYFGLDWTRNLAAEARKVLESPARNPSILDNDIRNAPFALVASSRDPVNGGRDYDDFPAYTEDAGFPTEGLPAILYGLAIREPGNFYLASINKQDSAGLRHHYHIAVLLPWFDEGGAFRVDVFESAAETSLIALVGRTKGQMAHLVRIRAERGFDPPLLPSPRLP